MIKNERQYKITRSERDIFKSTLDKFDLNAEIESGIDPLIAQAKLDQLKSEYDTLCEQIDEFENLSSGEQSEIVVSSLQNLPHALIKARIVHGWTQADLASILKLKSQQIQRYEADDYSTANLSTLVRVANALELDLTKLAILSVKPSRPTEFPINEMYKRGWFEDFSGTLNQAKNKYEDLIENFFIKSGYIPDQSVWHKKKARLSGNVDENSLLVWQARVVGLTKHQKLSQIFNKETLTPSWFRELAMLSQYENGPILARKKLLDSGIYFIVEPHLSKTYLDGAAIRHPNGSPIVALTARYDRLDNFWFVLFHELAHIHLHFGKKEHKDFFDDVDIREMDKIEEEADKFALETLLPEQFWENCLSRFSLDVDTIRVEANQFCVHSSIIAGRIRYEQMNYTILNDAIGHTEVSKMFQIKQ